LTSLKNSDDIKATFEEVLHKDISVVVSNAGINTGIEYEHVPAKTIETIINLNITPNCLLAAYFYERLIKRAENKLDKSAILFTASAASHFPNNHMLLYGMTKTFLRFFSLSLSEEKSEFIDVLCVSPGFVTTKLTFDRKEADTISTTKCIDGALKVLGQKSETSTNWTHHLIYKVIFASVWHISHEINNKLLNFVLIKTGLDKLEEKFVEREKNSLK
jgi:short-subunit dehydrogenase